jgi:hypothetical protein
MSAFWRIDFVNLGRIDKVNPETGRAACKRRPVLLRPAA